MAKASKPSVAVPPALPASAPRADAPVAAPVATKLTTSPVPADIGQVFSTEGVTFASPVRGTLKQGRKLNCGWPLIAEGTTWWIVPGTYVPEGMTEPRPAHVIVARVPAVAGTMGNGGKANSTTNGHDWKAWPYTTLRIDAGCEAKGGDA